MSYQSMLQQDEEYQRWAGCVWGSNCGRRSKPVVVESFVQETGGGAVLKSGEGGRAEGCSAELPAPLYVDAVNCGGIGADLRLFSPSELLFPPPSQLLQQSTSERFTRHGLLGLSRESGGRFQPDSSLPEFAGFGGEAFVEGVNSLNVYVQAEETLQLRRGDSHNNLSRAFDNVASDDVLRKVEAGPPNEFKEEWTNGTNLKTENWRKFGDYTIGGVKQEDTENIQEVHLLDEIQPRRKPTPCRLQAHPEDVVNFGPSGSTSQSDYDSEESKKEGFSRKRKRPGQDADGNVTWTDESVRFLFAAYDAIHQRLWEESKGQVKYQKKWTPILKAMQARFGNHFTKKQCQSKYWSVRRECSEYRITSAKAAATDPLWNPSIAGRELLKPKFYDVWHEVSGKNLESMITTGSASSGEIGEQLKGKPSSVLGRELQPVKPKIRDSSVAIKKLQRLMLEQLQASDEREEAMKHSAELMMNLLTQHIEHVETRVTITNESQTPQLHLLEVIDFKLEKVLEGFSALNQNLSLLH